MKNNLGFATGSVLALCDVFDSLNWNTKKNSDLTQKKRLLRILPCYVNIKFNCFCYRFTNITPFLCPHLFCDKLCSGRSQQTCPILCRHLTFPTTHACGITSGPLWWQSSTSLLLWLPEWGKKKKKNEWTQHHWTTELQDVKFTINTQICLTLASSASFFSSSTSSVLLLSSPPCFFFFFCLGAMNPCRNFLITEAWMVIIYSPKSLRLAVSFNCA